MLLDESAKNGLTLWRVRGRCLKGAVQIEQGDATEGLRLIRQLMTENLLMAALGGALGILIAYAAVPLLRLVVPVMSYVPAMFVTPLVKASVPAPLTLELGCRFRVPPSNLSTP